jgi:tetratricopeptide (TPR) repeat protein
MKRVISFLATTVFMLMAIVSWAQPTKKADEQFDKAAYYEATKLYIKAEPVAKSLDEKARIFYRLGECYRLVADPQQSLQWYEKAIVAQYYKTEPEVYYGYGMSLLELGRWDDAVTQFNKYSAKGGDKSKAALAIKSAQDAASKKASKTRITVSNVVELNSEFFDYGLVFSGPNEVVLSSARPSSAGSYKDPITGESFMDLFTAKVDQKGKFGVPVPLPGVVNTMGNEGAACFNKDYSEILYTSCAYTSAKIYSACNIARATRNADGKFLEVTNLNVVDRNADDSTVVGQPFLTSDGKYLLFASNMAGGKGGKDIWYINYDRNSSAWSKPINLAVVNSKGDDMFPVIGPDGTLYFSSNGWGGLGGLDVFKAAKNGDMSFEAPVGVDYPLNSSSNDFALVIDPKKEGDKTFSGYITSDRPGGKGKDDIYRFVEAGLDFSLVGTVYDKDSGAPVSGAEITLVGSSN